jgi:hypothetical protein
MVKFVAINQQQLFIAVAIFILLFVNNFIDNKKLKNAGCISVVILSLYLLNIFGKETEKENDNKQKLHKFKKMIKKYDNENNTSHIVIGDYHEDVEKDSNYKIINIDNGENFLYPLQEAYKKELPLSIILETEGGDISSGDIIFRSLLEYPFGACVYIINYAFSAGTFISLACGKIYMSKWALMGPTDPQLTCEHSKHEFTGSSKHFINFKNYNGRMSEQAYIIHQEAELYHGENIKYMTEALNRHGYSEKAQDNIKKELGSGTNSHGMPFNYRILNEMGLKVFTDIPEYIFKINKKVKEFKD